MFFVSILCKCALHDFSSTSQPTAQLVAEPVIEKGGAGAQRSDGYTCISGGGQSLCLGQACGWV